MSTIASSDSDSRDFEKPSAVLLWDRQKCLPLSRILAEDDVLLLLTPVVVPQDADLNSMTDPFESLGKSLSIRHPAVRHVPYTKAHGITGAHVAFIRRVKAIIFVVTGSFDADGAAQAEFAQAVAHICDNRPLVIIACCHVGENSMHLQEFPTVIRSQGFSKSHLEAISSILLEGESSPTISGSTPSDSTRINPEWTTQQWNYERDAPEAHALWIATMPRLFHLESVTFASLLRRDGYAMHYVVRDPGSGHMIGFCATYTTFADSSGDRLIGSIAAILVRQDYRRRGIGRILHDEAMGRMGRIRGVTRIQLGSTFPRLLYGLPTTSTDAEWFQRRGWETTESVRGRGYFIADWTLKFEDIPRLALASAGLNFRCCQISDVPRVMSMVSKASSRKPHFGWYDQYAKILDSSYLGTSLLDLRAQLWPPRPLHISQAVKALLLQTSHGLALSAQVMAVLRVSVLKASGFLLQSGWYI